MTTPANNVEPPTAGTETDKWPDTVCVYIYSLFNGRVSINSKPYFNEKDCEIAGKKAQNEHGLDYILTLESKELPLPHQKEFVKLLCTLVHCKEASKYMQKNCMGCKENLANQLGHLCVGLGVHDKLYVIEKTRASIINNYVDKFLYMYDLPTTAIANYVDAYKYYSSDDSLLYDLDTFNSESEFALLATDMLF